MSIRRTSSLAVLAAAALACTTTPAREPSHHMAPTKPTLAWDQAKVTSIAKDLAKACADLYSAYYASQGASGGQIGSGDAEDSHRLGYKLNFIQVQTHALASALAAGKGRLDTLPMVEDIGEVARDARVLLARMFVQSPLQARIDAARKIWFELTPYYGVEAPRENP